MKLDIWKPLYVDDFDCDKYLYHYTSVETAVKIICSDSLLFSHISRTNDTSEAKMKIAFDQTHITDADKYKEITTKIFEYFKQYTQVVQLLCFSLDAKISEKERQKYIKSMGKKDIYYDVSGRGFALPRMWAQYAGNNEGVCFIFNRNKLISLIEKKVAFAKHEHVKYKKFFDRYLITNDKMEDLYEKISMVSNGSLTLLGMIQKDKDFLRYNFFEKLDDWKNEHEYRILALIDKKDKNDYRLPIKGLSSFLEGVVIGEKMDFAYEKTIKMLIESIDKNCEVKRIRFDTRLCKLT